MDAARRHPWRRSFPTNTPTPSLPLGNLRDTSTCYYAASKKDKSAGANEPGEEDLGAFGGGFFLAGLSGLLALLLLFLCFLFGLFSGLLLFGFLFHFDFAHADRLGGFGLLAFHPGGVQYSFEGFFQFSVAQLFGHPLHGGVVGSGVAAAGEAVFDDKLGEVLSLLLQGFFIGLPEAAMGRYQGNGLHVGFDVDVVVFFEELVEAEVVFVLEVDVVDVVPDGGVDHVGGW